MVSRCCGQFAGQCIQGKSLDCIIGSGKINVSVPIRRRTEIPLQIASIYGHAYSIGYRLHDLAVAGGVEVPHVVAVDHIDAPFFPGSNHYVGEWTGSKCRQQSCQCRTEAAVGFWVEGDHAVYSVISSSRNASSNSYRTPRVLSPGEQIKRVKAMRVNSGARVELATGDIDVSKCRINDGSWRNSNDRGHTA